MFDRWRRKRAEPVEPVRQLTPEQFATMRGPPAVIQAETAAPIPVSDGRAWEALFGPNVAGVSPDSAMAHSAFYRCVFLISSSIAMLDFGVYRVDDDGNRQRDTTSAPARLLNARPNRYMSPTMLWRTVAADMLRNGNGIVWIKRRVTGEPVGLYPIPWSRVGITTATVAGEMTLVYGLTLDDGTWIVALADDVLHIPGSAVWKTWRAMSPLTAYAMSVGIAISADNFAKAYFDNASAPDGYLTYPNALKNGKDQAEELRRLWASKFSGPNRFNGPAVLTEGGKYETITIANAVDSQLLQARAFAVSDIGRILGVPDHLLNLTDKTTSFGSGIEELSRHFIDLTLGPHLKAIEDEVSFKLVRQSTKIAEFDREGFVRGNLESRMSAIQKGLGGAQGSGVMTQNEARAKIGLGRKDDPGADRLYTASPAAAPPQPGDEPAPKPDPKEVE